MTPKEAIERIKTRFDKWALDDKDFDAIRTLIPELAESEDERMRKTLLEYFNERNSYRDEDETFYGVPFPSIIAYLEKQKEQEEWANFYNRYPKLGAVLPEETMTI